MISQTLALGISRALHKNLKSMFNWLFALSALSSIEICNRAEGMLTKRCLREKLFFSFIFPYNLRYSASKWLAKDKGVNGKRC